MTNRERDNSNANSLSKPRLFSVHDLIILAAFISLVSLEFKNFADDPGVGWHLENGQYILDSKAIPRLDPFLSYPEPRRWISDQWLSDLIFYLVYKLASWSYLYVGLTALYLLTYFGILYRGIVRETLPQGSVIAAAVATLMAFKLGLVHFILRPVVLSFFCFVLVYVRGHAFWAKLSDSKFESRAGFSLLSFRFWREALLLVALFALWANLHPAFVLGLFLLFLIFLGLLLDWLAIRPSKEQVYKVLLVFLLLAFSSLATLVNPYGAELHRSVLKLGASSYFMRLHEEWLPLELGSVEGQIFLMVLALIFIYLAVSFEKTGKVSTLEVLEFFAFAFLSLRAVRFLPFFGIVASIPLARTLPVFGEDLVFQKYRSFAKLKAWLERLEAHARASWQGLGALAVIVAVLMLYPAFTGRMLFFAHELGPRKTVYPYEALSFLSTLLTSDGPVTIASLPEWGGFITFQGQGKLKPVIDDRNTLIGESFYQNYFSEVLGCRNWEPLLRQLGARYLLFRAKSRLAFCLQERAKKSPDINIIFEDKIALLAELK